MSGIEVAGIVLAVIPMVVSSLKYSQKSTILFKRQRHVDKLIHALLEQEVLLEENIKLLLVKVGVERFPDDSASLARFLGKDVIDERVEDYLGQHAYSAYKTAVLQCEKAVGRIATRIGGICDLSDPLKVRLMITRVS